MAYVTTGHTAEAAETRRRTLCRWTQELLAELGMEKWGTIFRFTAVALDDLYKTPIFEAPVWYWPDSAVPVPLFPG